MSEDLKALMEENETLKKKNKKLKREIIMNKMELETELDCNQRRQDLLNLLTPRVDMKDLTQVFFAYIIRMLPFKTAYIKIVKGDYQFELKVIGKHGNIHTDESYIISDGLKLLIEKTIQDKKGLLIENLKNYNSSLFDSNNTLIINPLFIGNNSYGVVYIENDIEGSYSIKEFEIIEEILLDVSLIVLNSINYTKLLNLRSKEIINPKSGLYNERYLLNVLEKQIIISKITKLPFSLFLIKFNDSSSNIKEVLINKIAKLFSKLTRKVDTIFEYEDDKLALLINNSDENVADIVLKRLEKGKILLREAEGEFGINFAVYTYSGEQLIANMDILKHTKESLEKS